MRPIRLSRAITMSALVVGVVAPQAAHARVDNPFGPGSRLYASPSGPATQQAREWRGARPEDARMMERIARRPVATWLGDWNARVGDDAARLAGRARRVKAVPVVVAYNIPQRDCGSYSAGGARSEESYERWIGDLAGGLGRGPAAVILEPDAVAGWDCLDTAGRQRRARMLKNAVSALSKLGIAVYLDAGNSNWQPPAVMASRLRSSGLSRARGIAVNVSNFRSTSESLAYVRALRRKLPGLRAVIDTSRNGRGPAAGAQWCNPPGRGLGRPPTVSPGASPLDALLWIKAPGESDGNCNGGPSAGVWWPEQALELARNAL